LAEDFTFFQGAAKLAGLTVARVGSAAAICQELVKDPSSLLVVDASTPQQYSAFESNIAEKVGLFSAVVNPNNYFYVANAQFHELPFLPKSDIFGHFIPRTYQEENQAIVGRLFKMASVERAFGFENYFPEGTQTQSFKVTKSLQKRAIVESLKEQLLKLGFKARIATVIASATDEVIMNAIFDAPVDGAGKHIYAQTPRSASFDLVDKNVVEIKTVFDGTILGVSVRDQHGSLDKKKLLSQHLGKSYESHQYEARTATAGAGLGLAHVYRNCGGMIFVAESGMATEVHLFFKKSDSFKDFKDQFRFLSTFMYF
jgi:hypothetical protein